MATAILTNTQTTGTAFRGTGGPMRIFVTHSAGNIVIQAQDFQATPAWQNVTQSVIGSANITADGVYEMKSSQEVMYRLNPAQAGSRAWLVR